MELANKVVSTVTKAANNNTVISVCLVGSFLALSVRSVNQQRDIEAMEAEKESLTKSNKAMKKAMWDWKQQLFAEASTDSALIPLARLKAIYGEAPASQIGTLSLSLYSLFFFAYAYFLLYICVHLNCRFGLKPFKGFKKFGLQRGTYF